MGGLRTRQDAATVANATYTGLNPLAAQQRAQYQAQLEGQFDKDKQKEGLFAGLWGARNAKDEAGMNAALAKFKGTEWEKDAQGIYNDGLFDAQTRTGEIQKSTDDAAQKARDEARAKQRQAQQAYRSRPLLVPPVEGATLGSSAGKVVLGA